MLLLQGWVPDNKIHDIGLSRTLSASLSLSVLLLQDDTAGQTSPEALDLGLPSPCNYGLMHFCLLEII